MATLPFLLCLPPTWDLILKERICSYFASFFMRRNQFGRLQEIKKEITNFVALYKIGGQNHEVFPCILNVKVHGQ